MDLGARRVVVVGLGRSGIAAAKLCRARGASVVGTDLRHSGEAPAAMLELDRLGVELHLGTHDTVPWDDADLVVVSPGVPSFEALERVESSGREVIGELELACRFARAPVALVGGTNGKSTVTSWLGEMLAGDGRRVFVGGNLGTPFAEEVDRDFDVVVLEISSFQAERIPTLHARAAVLLNVTDDHLDRYPDFEAYARAKGNVFAAMGPSDTAVIPAGDGVCARQAARGRARIVSFGPGGEVCERDGWLQDGVSGARHATAAIRLAGRHNLLNACAAVAMASSLGAPPDAVARALAGFAGLPHRTAFVAQLRSVRFYDDSKGTNVGASVVALRGLAEPRAVLVAGGRDKLGSYEPLVEALRDKGRALVVLGEAAGRIAAAASGVLPIARAATMSDAVREAFSLAAPGDAVLLSPACSSFDMFTDYKHRGRAFCEAVAALALELGDRPPRPRGGP